MQGVEPDITQDADNSWTNHHIGGTHMGDMSV